MVVPVEHDGRTLRAELVLDRREACGAQLVVEDVLCTANRLRVEWREAPFEPWDAQTEHVTLASQDDPRFGVRLLLGLHARDHHLG